MQVSAGFYKAFCHLPGLRSYCCTSWERLLEEGNTEFAQLDEAEAKSAKAEPVSASSPVVVAVETEDMTDDGRQSVTACG